MTSVLENIRVVDLTQALAGPYCTMLLGDMNADVIKIETPGCGDQSRGWGPPFVEGESTYFLSINRNKRSLTLDIKSAEGQEVLHRLISSTDVFVCNIPKESSRRRAGVDLETLQTLNPRLIYCSISGFGQTGPYKDKPGYDLLVQAMGGLMSITGDPDGEPMKVGVAVADIFTGLYAAVAILAALNERRSSDKGQHIDLALLDVQIATLANQGMNFLASGKTPRRHGNTHPNIVPYQAFATSDGHIVIAVGNDAQFARFVALLGFPELSKDPRFQKNADRVRNRTALIEVLGGMIRTFRKLDLLSKLEAELIPVGSINEMHEVFADPHVAARGLVVEQNLSAAGPATKMIGNPIRFSRTPIQYRHPPPRLGAHTAEIIRGELEISQSELDRLVDQGVVSKSNT